MSLTHLSDGPELHCWESLPPAVLGRCLRTGSRADDFAAFSTCTSAMRAMIIAAPKPQITVGAGGFKPSLATVLHRIAAWDVSFEIRVVAEADGDTSATPAREPADDLLEGVPHGSLQPLLRMLHQEGVRLPRVTRVSFKGVLLDAYAPAGLEAVFPNLHHLEADSCRVPPKTLPLSALTSLQSLVLSSRLDQPPTATSDSTFKAWSSQLRRLAGLPSLSSLTIHAHHYPTSFLPLWAAHLTDLQLIRTAAIDSGGPSRGSRWRPALAHAAQCSNLRRVKLGFCSVASVTALSPLTQLQELDLGVRAGADGDKILRALLRFPQLTRLTCRGLTAPAQSFADHPCMWRQLQLGVATPLLLSRLPLHSLTAPLQLEQLDIAANSGAAAAATAAAAAANLARSNQHVVTCRPHDMLGLQIKLPMYDASLRALLLAAAPLVPSGTSAVAIRGCGAWGADQVVALQQVMPATLKKVTFDDCVIKASFWRQLARSFPRLGYVNVFCSEENFLPSAMELMGYFSAACAVSAASKGHLGNPQAAKVYLHLDEEEDEEEEEEEEDYYRCHCRFEQYEELEEQLVCLGLPDHLLVRRLR